MISRLTAVTTDSTDPYLNLAMEEWLTFHAAEDEVILYLWQNERTVVIGRNQCAWTECDLGALAASGGHLARRLSGGGAVYHDLGNLNFTFAVRQSCYDVPRQMRVLVRALAHFGIRGEVSGRNDLTVQGAKCSGNAFFRSGDFRYHHGTLLVSADMTAMSRYLTPDRKKLEKKGVRSVKSRVMNLADADGGTAVSIPSLQRELVSALEEEYGLKAEYLPAQAIPSGELESLRERYCSEEWLMRAPESYDWLSGVRRLSFGMAQLGIRTGSDPGGEKIRKAVLYTDALDPDISERVQEALFRVPFTRKDMLAALAASGLEEAGQLLDE